MLSIRWLEFGNKLMKQLDGSWKKLRIIYDGLLQDQTFSAPVFSFFFRLFHCEVLKRSKLKRLIMRSLFNKCHILRQTVRENRATHQISSKFSTRYLMMTDVCCNCTAGNMVRPTEMPRLLAFILFPWREASSTGEALQSSHSVGWYTYA